MLDPSDLNLRFRAHADRVAQIDRAGARQLSLPRRRSGAANRPRHAIAVALMQLGRRLDPSTVVLARPIERPVH